ncbi:cob(I)yrinic acid a,c-diamide adenosyltransferase [Planctomycetales bacterium]|nr:cob(I)yrinic acid a,c-diamide adenosyltransferase [Planctomycetales bacterium]GHT35561.1 cob(I)yrinic acid a,c-diamide adenosyltransferase [Planctomycetales bacterium]
MIYTRAGDSGTTYLFSGQVVPKDDLRICVCGEIDELTSVLGIARAEELQPQHNEIIFRIQKELIGLCTDVSEISETAGDISAQRITAQHILQIEKDIDAANLPPLTEFVIPGKSRRSAYLHLARTVCRRAERNLTSLIRSEPKISGFLLQYLNRLSDLLFVLAEKE